MKIFDANLTSGSSYIKTGGTGLAISWLRNLGTNQGSEKCNLQGVVRITFPFPINGKQKCHLKFNLQLGTKGADASVEHLTYTVTAAIIPFCTAITKQ